MERSNLTNDERFDIDEHHGEMMCLITDQAFIAGLFAGLKMAALTEVTLDSARQAEN
jgi:hypothetical protein